jgi:spore coat polysaccharide biosynthesis protein SpsF
MMSLTKLAIIQARMGSSRLPGKVMLDIEGKPMLQHVVERAQKASLLDQVVIATTNDPSDDILEGYCRKSGLPFYRGSLSDVLDRFYQAALQYQADVIIRLTADCPLLDADLIDFTIMAFLGQPVSQDPVGQSQAIKAKPIATSPVDFSANRLPPPWKRSIPIGLDVEVCSFKALKRAWLGADQLFQREHVMPYLYEGVAFLAEKPTNEWYIQQSTSSRGFKVAVLNHNPDLGALRWTVDTPEDLEFIRQVYRHFNGQEYFGWKAILALLDREPELSAINASVMHKSAFDVDNRNNQA